jgi:hypothetical protein
MSKLTGGKRKRGRPPKPNPAAAITDLRAAINYEPPAPGEVIPIAEIANWFRKGAETAGPEQMCLAGWYRGTADAIEAGDAARTGWCAQHAIVEIYALMSHRLMPLARIGKKKLEVDKRRGRRTGR